MRSNGSKHLAGKQLRDVVYYAEEVVRESSGEDSPTAEFWEMVEV